MLPERGFAEFAGKLGRDPDTWVWDSKHAKQAFERLLLRIRAAANGGTAFHAVASREGHKICTVQPPNMGVLAAVALFEWPDCPGYVVKGLKKGQRYLWVPAGWFRRAMVVRGRHGNFGYGHATTKTGDRQAQLFVQHLSDGKCSWGEMGQYERGEFRRLLTACRIGHAGVIPEEG